MKRPTSAQTERRDRFVLTPEETRIISFVLVMFFLGIATARYRSNHSISPPATAVRETAKSAGLPAQRRAESKHRNLPR